ncbi:hypothetical protein CRG49_001230 [Neisseria sp. N95_16]|uniref:Uncharacterized protein n=1 Tax=Neisseria brasiliensis TaxID=2666100 RepID=A0A5Q3S4Z6_9NEIS|nr:MULTISPECIES: hypothetical protein [Neisseria]MRN39025.1 hypothetical protein [Neisseria brasiliensis]PJO10612.1 hypothetical protein CRG49_001230 [Neisseria sp. N95_16]PJO77477.1 hypothetical protein CWC45_10220 [Neisseria sp. N177_16]QGL25854.1 hypothetical protein GJV52_10105 [Neisseria brasiliensis]
MKTREYLFEGLENLNDGFDAESIIYVSEQDFETVLNRAEAKNIAIYGIEPWYERDFFDVRVYDFTGYEANDPRWYRAAFEEFKSEQSGLMYAMTYDNFTIE